jgi:CDP-4-dehydro-6-deoxyglucose reductase
LYSTVLTKSLDEVRAQKKFPLKKLIYTVETFEELSNTIIRVFLKPPAEDCLHYHAGQYLEILQRDEDPKPFSIANAPHPNNTIELHIRHSPENVYTSTLIHEIKTEKKLLLRAPYGNCILRNTPPYPLIFLAGGAGFAPIKALIEHALTENNLLPIYLYWGARIVSDFYLNDLANYWKENFKNFHYVPVLSGEDKNWKGETGWVHESVMKSHPDLSRFHIYASGPTEMVYTALQAFQTRGLNRALMYSDVFL